MFKKFLLIVLTISVIGISANSISAQINMTYSGASKIERKIRSEILSLPYYGVFDAIGYQLNGDTVTLNGYVVRPITKKDAEIRSKTLMASAMSLTTSKFCRFRPTTTGFAAALCKL